MKKTLLSLAILMTISTALYSLPAADAKKQAESNTRANTLTKNIQSNISSIKETSNPIKQQQLKKELDNNIEQATTYFDSVKNFFGYGPLAEKRRAQAEKRKYDLEQKLLLEKKRFKELNTTTDKEKSVKYQNKLARQIHTEKIALGQEWSLQQKALATALAGATAYVGYQYGGQAVAAAKKLLTNEPSDAEMMAAFPISPRERLWSRRLDDITVEDYIEGGTSNTLSPTNTEISTGWGQWAQDQAYYFYNLLPSLRSTPTNE